MVGRRAWLLPGSGKLRASIARSIIRPSSAVPGGQHRVIKRALRRAGRIPVVETFVVRVLVGAEPGVERLRGVASHVASGQELTFAEAEALLAFLADPHCGGEGVREERGATDENARP